MYKNNLINWLCPRKDKKHAHNKQFGGSDFKGVVVEGTGKLRALMCKLYFTIFIFVSLFLVRNQFQFPTSNADQRIPVHSLGYQKLLIILKIKN